MSYKNGLSCCGIIEIADIHEEDTPKDTLRWFLNDTVQKEVYVPNPEWEAAMRMPGGYRIARDQGLDPGHYQPLPEPIFQGIRGAYGIFSGVKDEKYAQRFAAYIKRHKLGKVIKAPERVNPNSENKLCVYMWVFDQRAIAKWVKVNMKGMGRAGDEDEDDGGW